jgi:hypothetical protein
MAGNMLLSHAFCVHACVWEILEGIVIVALRTAIYQSGAEERQQLLRSRQRSEEVAAEASMLVFGCSRPNDV